jgi:hypothetical protein
MHQQQRNKRKTECQLLVKGIITFMPIGNSMPFSELNYGDNITGPCKANE